MLGLARRHGWRVCHYRPAFSRGRRVTPVSGDPGGPDLTLARGGVVLLAELKLDAGRLRPEQHVWAKEIGPNYRLWRPSMWEAIVAELAKGLALVTLGLDGREAKRASIVYQC